MVTTHKHKKLVWIDLDSPTPEEVKEVMKKYPLHPLVAEELLYPTLRPRIDAYDKVIYLVLHFPVFDHSRRGFSESEVDFIVGKNFIITTHYRDFNTLHEIARMFETDTLSGDDKPLNNVGLLFFKIIKEMYALSINELAPIQAKILAVEEEIFSRSLNKRDLVRKISHVRRDVLDFRRTIHPHREVLAALKSHGEKFFGVDFSLYMSFLNSDYLRLFHTLENDKDTIESLQATNDSLVSFHTNSVTKTLTMMAFMTFPLMVIIGLFSIPAKSVPIIGITGDFWIILTIVAGVLCGLYAIFKRRGWL